jgi:hypothetical protein
MNKKRFRNIIQYGILFFLAVALSGCNMPNQAEVTPTLDSTQAYQTIQARLTEAVALTPSITPSPTATQTPTATATQGITPSPTTSTAVATTATPTGSTSSCDQASPGTPIDVTIPDDTNMQPGQTFSKTWRLVNSGTCTWSSSYSLVFFSGERMGALERVPLTGNVTPGQSVDLTVEMVAPTAPGTYQSNWKLRNANNQLFGIGPGEGLPFYVRIIVVGTGTVSPTPDGTTTVTPTPPSGTSGSGILFPADRINLETIQVNSGSGDLAYLQDSTDNRMYLVPQDSTVIGVYGGFLPELAACQVANLSATPLAVEDIAVGAYLCHRTSGGSYGWLRITGFNPDNSRLDVSGYTWNTP